MAKSMLCCTNISNDDDKNTNNNDDDNKNKNDDNKNQNDDDNKNNKTRLNHVGHGKVHDVVSPSEFQDGIGLQKIVTGKQASGETLVVLLLQEV